MRRGDARRLALPDASAGASVSNLPFGRQYAVPGDPEDWLRLVLGELARVTADRCVVSVPWEPWFRLGNLGRGKNVRRLGNDPEHVGWFTPGRLRRTLERSFTDVRIVRAFPWLIAEAHGPCR